MPAPAPAAARPNRTRYWVDSRLQGLSLLCADFSSHEYPPHCHEALVVAVTEAGGAEVKSRGRVEQAEPAALFVFNPAEPHAGWMGCSRRWRYRGFYLAQPALGLLQRRLGQEALPYVTRNRIADPALVAGFRRLHRALETPDEGFLADELLVRCFARLRRHSGAPRPPLPPRDAVLLRRAKEIMRERHAEPLLLEEIAAALGLSTFQLIAFFRRTIGLTPHAYLVQLRLNSACRALKRGVPLAAAATGAGFYDQAALSKHFRRRFGMTPRQFARANAAA